MEVGGVGVVEEGVEDEVGEDGKHPKLKCPNLLHTLFNKLVFFMQSPLPDLIRKLVLTLIVANRSIMLNFSQKGQFLL